MQPQANGVLSDAVVKPPRSPHDSTIADSTSTPATLPNVASDAQDLDYRHRDALQANALASPEPPYSTPPPRGTKRKLTVDPPSSAPKSSKRPSPPWKDFNPANPTAFRQDGKRKSGRVNALPLELLPQGATRGKSAAYQQKKEVSADHPKQRGSRRHVASRGSPQPPAAPPLPRRRARSNNGEMPTTKEPPTRRKQVLYAPTQTQHRKPTGRRSSKLEVAAEPMTLSEPATMEIVNQSSTRPVKSLRLKFQAPSPPVLCKWNIPPPKKYQSLDGCLQDIIGGGEDGVRPWSTNAAREEALTWAKLEKASGPGGHLSTDLQLAGPVQYPHAPKQFPNPPTAMSHQDYVCAHVVMFAKALREEERDHRKRAKERAYQALEKWKTKQPRSEAELAIDARFRYKTVLCKELLDKWAVVKGVVSRRKLEEYERVQKERADREMKGALDTLLNDQTDALRRRKGSHVLMDGGEPIGQDAPAETLEYALESDGDESLSESSDEDDDDDDDDSSTTEDSDQSVEEEFGDLTGDALRKRIYGEASMEEPATLTQPSAFTSASPDGAASVDASHTTIAHVHVSKGGLQPHHSPSTSERGDSESPMGGNLAVVELEHVADELLDDDESDSSEDDEDDSESSESCTDEDDEVSGSDTEGSHGLWGFFSKDAQRDLHDLSLVVPIAAKHESGSPQPSRDELQPLLLQPASGANSTSDGEGGEDTPATAFSKQSNREDVAALDTHTAASLTPVSILMRGTLREYQHRGLHWLADLHTHKQNGILADEMGLGKTIQTISLLAHLATERKIWGPHLVIVPTSVMLNWEMEFKKFLPGFKILTYYGNQEERKAKRKGWMDHDRWNVCITSYQLALQDASALKRRDWYYMVLDEAHNIKNFKSQRWQTLLHFKSKARLLLTGTPLQNSLTELWSLLAFLHPDLDVEGNTKFKDLQTFAHMFNKPAEQILDHGREGLNDESRALVKKLQVVLRPHLLRRLKADVEKQMPKKFEHVVKCRLSKRQRQLYDGYMAMAGTRETFASGNYMSIIGCLMQLRKVCNHPDLFETRQIVTSFAMPASAVADFEIKELLVRKKLIGVQEENLASRVGLLDLWQENTGTLTNARSRRLAALHPLELASRNLKAQLDGFCHHPPLGMALTLERVLAHRQRARMDELNFHRTQTAVQTQRAPLYGAGLIQRYTFEKAPHLVDSQPKRRARLAEWCLSTSLILQDMFDLRPAYSALTHTTIQKFGCVTPAVIAPGITRHVLTTNGTALLQRLQPPQATNPYHEAQTRLSIAFPDKSLIQYDCGKLQQLDKLLRELQSGGHRALIFTQMTKVLDILEQFLNLHGHRYLRLDGATKVESRQALTDQFNQDTRILAFILSSRSGGIGINLTGADTVIFYDLDWNPAMDKQCQDRCHRIGQTRDVHIYRFVSEGTIEANILRKSNQKRMLDDVVIQEGQFTTEEFYRPGDGDEIDAEADAALDKVLGGGRAGRRRDETLLDQVEDQEDREAARQAEKEDAPAEDVDFKETIDARYDGPQVSTLVDEGGPTDSVTRIEEADDTPGSYEEYMLRLMEYELRDAAVIVQSEQQRKRAKKGKGHGVARIRA